MPPRTPQPAPSRTVEVVDPRWLLKAGAIAFAAALICAYLAVCLLFWQGQWQLVITPSATVAATPASLSLPFEAVRFGVDATGKPQLTGWWIPSDSPSDPTVLLLHGVTGNMADSLASAQSLHAARLNVFIFDYHGFGSSSGPHPTQGRMEKDSDTALDFLISTRHIPLASIIPFGEAAGASLATRLAAAHREIPAIILFHPDGDFTNQVKHDPRSRLAPVSLLFHEDFPLAAPLASLPTPKLLFTSSTDKQTIDLRHIADPRMTVDIRTGTDRAAEPLRSLTRFLDSYVPRPLQQLTPTH